MARFHFLWAFGFLIVFLVTGFWMGVTFSRMDHIDPTMRMLYRSAHVYILLGAIANAAFAIDLKRRSGWRGKVQWVASFLMALLPVLFLAAFIFEPAPGRLDRPISFCGVICGMIAVVLGALPHFSNESDEE